MEVEMKMSAKNVGLIVAVEMFAVFEGWGRPDKIYEGLPFKLCHYDRYGRRVFVVRSGPGTVNAEAAARMLADKFDACELWNFGVVGGLTEEARVGDIFVVDEVVRWDGDGAERGRISLRDCGSRLEVIRVDVAAGAAVVEDGSLGARAGRRARLASGNSVVSARRARERLAAITGADIVDMEAAGIADTAAAGGYSCFMIKCVSDDLDTDKTKLTSNFRQTARKAFDAFDVIFKNS